MARGHGLAGSTATIRKGTFLVDTDLTDAPTPGTPAIATRRRLLGAGLTGAAMSLLPFVVRRAGAQSETTTPGGAATTTTAPPKRPTEEDTELLAFAQTVELAALELYEAAVAAGGLSVEQGQVLDTVLEAHRAFANAWSALLGRAASGTTNEVVVADRRGDFSSTSVDARLRAAYELESALVSTYHDIVGQLRGTDGAALTAAILIAAARHGTVLADVAGNTDLESLLVDDESAAIEAEG